MNDHQTLIGTDSLCEILTELKHWRTEYRGVTKAAEAADKAWRTMEHAYLGLRFKLHALLMLEDTATDEQLVNALRAKLSTGGLKDGSALSTVDAQFGQVRSISIGGIDLEGYIANVNYNEDGGMDITGMAMPPTPEQLQAYAAAAGGRAAAMVQDQPAGGWIGPPAEADTEQPEAGQQRTESMQPVDRPGIRLERFGTLTGRVFHHGETITGDIPLALGPESGQLWDWAGHDDHQRSVYANEDRTEVLTFSSLLERFGTLYEVQLAEGAER